MSHSQPPGWKLQNAVFCMIQHTHVFTFLILWVAFVQSSTPGEIQTAQELLKDPVLCRQIYLKNKPVEIRIRAIKNQIWELKMYLGGRTLG